MKMLSRPKLAALLVSVFLISFGSRVLYDRWRLTSPYDPQIYVDLIARLRAQGYSFVTEPIVVCGNSDITAKYVIVVHDVDADPHGLYTLVRIENSSGVRSIFYIRPNMEYMTYVIPYLQYIEKQGWMIGFHYDVLTKAKGNETQAIQVFKAQLTYLRTFFNITTTRAHGDAYDPNMDNAQLYRNHPELWHSLNITDLSGLEMDHSMAISDSHHDLQIPDSFQDHILLLLHSDWW